MPPTGQGPAKRRVRKQPDTDQSKQNCNLSESSEQDRTQAGKKALPHQSKLPGKAQKSQRLWTETSYGVLTLVSGSGLTGERMKGFVPIFEQNGAMLLRFGTLITGSNAGKRLLGVSYPSMDAIEKTYDGLRASADYQSLLSEVNLERREIVRFVG